MSLFGAPSRLVPTIRLGLSALVLACALPAFAGQTTQITTTQAIRIEDLATPKDKMGRQTTAELIQNGRVLLGMGVYPAIVPTPFQKVETEIGGKIIPAGTVLTEVARRDAYETVRTFKGKVTVDGKDLEVRIQVFGQRPNGWRDNNWKMASNEELQGLMQRKARVDVVKARSGLFGAFIQASGESRGPACLAKR